MVELPEALAKAISEHARRNGKKEGQSVYAFVLHDAHKYRNISYAVNRMLDEAEFDNDFAVGIIANSQLAIEQTERENQIMKDNGY